jgi:myo-inositol 2-dehydrogenase/D-chiro-inositol 1-dehydrogenase
LEAAVQRIALVGAGFMGGVHAANVAAHPAVEFAGVHDVDAQRAVALASRHATRSVDLDAAFDPARIDAVLIASSTDTHADHLRRAADAGIAVLCEKPIDRDLAAAAETVAYVEHHDVVAMVGFNRRFDRDYAALKQIVRNGEIGEVELIQLTSRGPSMPPLDYIKVSGGQMRDQAVHFFDLARWLSAEDPTEIYVAGSVLADPGISAYGDVDTSAATLRLPSGALVQIDCVRRTGYGYDERIEVLGSTGVAEARRQPTGGVVRYRAGQAVGDGLHPGWFERVQPTYAAELAAFVDALETGTAVPVTLQDGLKAQSIAEAATVSLTTGRSERIAYVEPTAPPR